MEAYGELRWKPIAVKTKCETGYVCPVTVTGKVMSGKYKAAILWNLYQRTLRYGGIDKIVPEVTDKMLSQRLEEMKPQGLIPETVYPIVPPKPEYALTAFGVRLIPVLDAMCDWGEQYLEKLEQGSCSGRSCQEK